MDNNEQKLRQLEERIATYPLLSWYYTHVLLELCSEEPTPSEFLRIFIIHIIVFLGTIIALIVALL